MSALPKGVARGVGGLVLKPISGVLGLGAYTAKGIHNSFRRRVRDTEKTERWIRRARIAQGQRAVQMLQEQEQLGPENQQTSPMPPLTELRNHALRVWSAVEKNKIFDEQEKEKRVMLLNKKARRAHLE
jgi:hypothetical protein